GDRRAGGPGAGLGGALARGGRGPRSVHWGACCVQSRLCVGRPERKGNLMTTATTEVVVCNTAPLAIRVYYWTFVVHLWTLTGLAFAAFALKATIEGDFDNAARLLIGVLLVDFTDGTLARLLQVKKRMPLISGEVIDYIHDLVGLTMVPMFFL